MGRKGKDKNKYKKQSKIKSKREQKREQKQSKKEKRGQKFRDDWDHHWKAFNALLQPHGLKLKECRADGNCLFRSFADQIERDESRHQEYRSKCINYMRENRDEFAVFMTEDYDEYLEEMSKLGEWGGNFEIIALSRAYCVNVIIHHETDPRYEIVYQKPDDDAGTSKVAGTIHLSYHDESHYNSVRPIDTSETGATDILAPDAYKDPTYSREKTEKKDVDVESEKSSKKNKLEQFKNSRKPGRLQNFKKMSKRDRKLAKKQEKAMRAKAKSSKRKENKEKRAEEDSETKAANDPGTIRI